MQRLRRLFSATALACMLVHVPEAIASTQAGYDFCFKRGDYYDEDGKGYHVIHCYQLGMRIIDIYYIAH